MVPENIGQLAVRNIEKGFSHGTPSEIMTAEEYSRMMAAQVHMVMYNLYCGLMINSTKCTLGDVKKTAIELCIKALDSIDNSYADHIESLHDEVTKAREEGRDVA